MLLRSLSVVNIPFLLQDLGYACCWPFLFYLSFLQYVQNSQLFHGVCEIAAAEKHRIASRSTRLSCWIRQTDPAYYASMIGYLDLCCNKYSEYVVLRSNTVGTHTSSTLC